VAALLRWVGGGWRWLWASVLSAAAAAWVHSGWFVDYLACSGDDLDGGVFVPATGSLGVVAQESLGPTA
jgi:hypothetical protein